MIVIEAGRLLAGERDVPGQQCFIVLEARGLGQHGEQRAQVTVGLDAVGLGGFDQRVEIGARRGAAAGVAEEPVLAADYEERLTGSGLECCINNAICQARPVTYVTYLSICQARPVTYL